MSDVLLTVTEYLDGVAVEGDSVVTITVTEGSGGGGGGVSDHGDLTGLTDDDHTQYLTNARGDARYDALGDADAAQAAAEATASAALTTHTADTTSVHGITDTSALVLTNDARLSDDRDPTAHAASHQDGGVDELALDGSQITTGTVADARIASTIARDSEVTAAVSAHEADTTNVHGIADTSALATTASVTSAISTHEADTTNVHGIADTSALVTTSTVAELARDALGTALVAGSNVTITPNDGADTITIAATGGSGGGFTAGAWYTMPGATSTASATLVFTRMYLMPIYVPSGSDLDAIAINVTTGGTADAVLRFGLYDDVAMQPTNLIVDAGTVASTSTGIKQVALSLTGLTGLWYWMVVCPQVASCSCMTSDTHSSDSSTQGPAGYTSPDDGIRRGKYQTGVSGALPATTSGSFTTPGSFPRVFIQAG